MSVVVTCENGVGVVELDWPQVRNALTMHTVVELAAAIRTVGADGSVSGIVLTGNGAFCSGFNVNRIGQDIGADQDGEPSRQEAIESLAQDVVRALVDAPVPTVAALDGAAVGMGMDLALACDSRLFGPEGWCMQGWGRIGLIPGTGGELLLRRLNRSLLWRLLETQSRIYGDEAERWGIGEAVTDMTARAAAVNRIRSFASLPRAAVAAYVSLFRADLRAALPAHLRECAQIQDRLLEDPDLPERIQHVLRRAGTAHDSSTG